MKGKADRKSYRRIEKSHNPQIEDQNNGIYYHKPRTDVVPDFTISGFGDAEKGIANASAHRPIEKSHNPQIEDSNHRIERNNRNIKNHPQSPTEAPHRSPTHKRVIFSVI